MRSPGRIPGLTSIVKSIFSVSVYADPRLQDRVKAPPKPRAEREIVASPDDWRDLPLAKPPASATHAAGPHDDAVNGGIRREPELPLHIDIAPPTKPHVNEFDFGSEGNADDDAARAERLRTRMLGNARQATLDPGDGIEL